MVEHRPRIVEREHHVLLGRELPDLGQAHAIGVTDVGVGLDQARHQGGARAVHHGGTIGPDLALAAGDLSDEVALQLHLARVRALGVAVENRHILEKGLCHRLSLRLGRALLRFPVPHATGINSPRRFTRRTPLRTD